MLINSKEDPIQRILGADTVITVIPALVADTTQPHTICVAFQGYVNGTQEILKLLQSENKHDQSVGVHICVEREGVYIVTTQFEPYDALLEHVINTYKYAPVVTMTDISDVAKVTVHTATRNTILTDDAVSIIKTVFIAPGATELQRHQIIYNMLLTSVNNDNDGQYLGCKLAEKLKGYAYSFIVTDDNDPTDDYIAKLMNRALLLHVPIIDFSADYDATLRLTIDHVSEEYMITDIDFACDGVHPCRHSRIAEIAITAFNRAACQHHLIPKFIAEIDTTDVEYPMVLELPVVYTRGFSEFYVEKKATIVQ